MCASLSPLKKKKKSEGGEWMVEHSPQILASEEKATMMSIGAISGGRLLTAAFGKDGRWRWRCKRWPRWAWSFPYGHQGTSLRPACKTRAFRRSVPWSPATSWRWWQPSRVCFASQDAGRSKLQLLFQTDRKRTLLVSECLARVTSGTGRNDHRQISALVTSETERKRKILSSVRP